LNRDVHISATIVLFHEEAETLRETITSFLEIPLKKTLYLLDNSATDALRDISNHPDVIYIFNKKNKGFGAANNQVISKIDAVSTHHLVLNPDISFSPSVMETLLAVLEKDSSLAMVAPKVTYPDGRLQYTCRKHPTVLGMFLRRTRIFQPYVKKRMYQEEQLAQFFYPEFIHGCFMLFKTLDFVQIEGFDPRYFLYMEDADICRKIAQAGKEIGYVPSASVVHVHRKGSAKKVHLLYHHINSAIKYFNKWGF